MPLLETLPVDASTAQWPLWSTTARIVVADPERVGAARAIVRELCDDVDRACSRFRPDAEIAALACAGGRPVAVSRLLAQLLRVALDAAERTGGDVDPTVGRALADLGYDRDLASIPTDAGPVRVTVRSRADWRSVELDGDRARVPAGVELDLGATAKAWTADRAAATVAERLGVGVLVSLGGDVATAGAPAGAGDWQVLVQDGPGEPAQQIALPPGTALATSSTRSRRWLRDSRVLHHIVDPVTGQPAEPVLRTVSVAAATCVEANTLSTAALVRGLDGIDLLRGSGLPARVVTAAGDVVRTGGWPAPA